MNILAKVTYGSRLYGTSIPTSDQDYRAIYLPDIKNCVLGTVKDAWEDKSVDDTSYFSLQHFCRLALEGQSIAIEMLAANKDNVLITSPIWKELQDNRSKFYTKSMHSFLGYAKTMSGKYSSRIDRLNDAEKVLKIFNHLKCDVDTIKLSAIWNDLPESINLEKTVNERNTGQDKRIYRVCGRELQATVTIGHAENVIFGISSSYGERVKKARDGQFEWKSLGHAFRAALQCKEIVETGDLQFPLKDAEWLRDLRLGKFDFFKEKLDEKLDNLIKEVQEKMDKSNLPEKSDKTFVDNLILKAYNL